MSTRKRLDAKTFRAINRNLKEGKTVKEVAELHDRSEETVRAVRRNKSWPRYEATKMRNNERRRPTASEQVIRKLDTITRAPENQIRPLPSTAIKVITIKEWEDLNRKLGDLYSLLGQRKGIFSSLWSRK